MLAINNQAKFNETVKEALTKSKNYPRWVSAVNKAVVQIELHGEFMTFDAENKSLLIWSQESNAIHAANGVCDCIAFKKGFPCFHRAAARLVRIYFEALESKPQSPTAKEMDSAPFLRNTNERKLETLAGVRF